jgi:hypothetical protein
VSACACELDLKTYMRWRRRRWRPRPRARCERIVMSHRGCGFAGLRQCTSRRQDGACICGLWVYGSVRRWDKHDLQSAKRMCEAVLGARATWGWVVGAPVCPGLIAVCTPRPVGVQAVLGLVFSRKGINRSYSLY